MKVIKYIILYLVPVPELRFLRFWFRNTDYLDNILENLEAKMPHKLRVVEGGEEKSALAAKRRFFLRIIKRNFQISVYRCRYSMYLQYGTVKYRYVF